jgi:uncharacterized delta-60 repeat protein
MKHLFFLSLVMLMHIASPLFPAQKRQHTPLHERIEQRRALKNKSTLQQSSHATAASTTFGNDSVHLFKELHYGSNLYPVDDIPLDILGDNNGDVYVIAVHAQEGKGSMRFIKYDAIGNEVWNIQNDSVSNIAYSPLARLLCDESGNIIVLYGSEYLDYSLMQYSPQGALLWKTDDNSIGAADLAIADNGNIIVLGNDYSDLYLTAYTASGTELWQIQYNGLYDYFDEGNAMALDDSNFIYVAGYSHYSSEENTDFITQKYSPDGVLLWTKAFYPSSTSDDEALFIALDSDNNVIVSGTLLDLDNYYNIGTVKYNSAGTKIWDKRYDGPQTSDDIVYGLDVDTSGNVYIAGSTWTEETNEFVSLVIKYKSNGTRPWVKNGAAGTEAYTIAVDDDGKSFITGYESSGQQFDFLTAQYAADGTEIWKTTYNGIHQSFDEALYIALDSADNIVITGQSATIQPWGDFDITTVKYNTHGVQQWAAVYRGENTSRDYLNASAIDAAGNIYATGRSYNESKTSDFITVKFTHEGMVEWQARYSSVGKFNDGTVAIALDNQSNVVVTGTIGAGTSSSTDIATIKYNSSGEQLWVATYDGTAQKSDAPVALAIDAQGNVIVAGTARMEGNRSYDFATIKYSEAGIEEWVAHYNGSTDSADFASALALDSKGNIYVTGTTWADSEDFNFATVKYNSSGIEQWRTEFDGDSSYSDRAVGITFAHNKIYVAGTTDNGTVITTLQYSPEGILQWEQTYSDTSESIDRVRCLTADASGTVTVAGTSFNDETANDFVMIQYDENGTQKWVARHNENNSSDDKSGGITYDADGNIYITGFTRTELYSTDSDILTIKYNTDGVAQWKIRYSREGASRDSANAVHIDNAGNVFVAGTSSRLPITEFTILHYAQIPNSVIERNAAPQFFLAQNYPNPFNPTTTIHFTLSTATLVAMKLYDVLGKEVAILINNKAMEAGEHEVTFDASSLSGGVYFYRLSAGNSFSDVKKFVLMK